MTNQKILRLPQVIKLTGIPRATIYHMMKDGDFPRPLKLSKRNVGWKLADIESWIESLEPTQ